MIIPRGFGNLWIGNSTTFFSCNMIVFIMLSLSKMVYSFHYVQLLLGTYAKAQTSRLHIKFMRPMLFNPSPVKYGSESTQRVQNNDNLSY